jgi:antitoxin component YwqK of YwqJK toxin-antitoxin module
MNVLSNKKVVFLIFIFSLSFNLFAQKNGGGVFTGGSDVLVVDDFYEYGNLNIEKFIQDLSNELNSGKPFSQQSFVLLLLRYNTEAESSFLKGKLIPYLAEIPSFEARKNYVNFLSRLLSEVEKFVIDIENNDQKLVSLCESLPEMPNDLAKFLASIKQEYKEAEALFISMTNEHLLNGSPKKKFYEDGKLARETFYNNTGQVIRVDEYYPGGATSKQILYSRAEGDIVINIEEYHENGKIKKQGSYLGTQKHGRFFEYDQNTGKILLEENYVNGKKEGVFNKFGKGGEYLLHEVEFVNDVKVKDITYRPNGAIQNINTYDSKGNLFTVEAFGKNNIRTTLRNYSDQTIIKYDPVSGDVIFVAKFDGTDNAWNSGDISITNESIKAQMMLMLSFSTKLSYQRISSLNNAELSEATIMSIINVLLVKREGSREYNLAVSLILMPGVLGFIEENSSNVDILDAVSYFAPIADSYNESRHIKKGVGNPSLVDIKLTEAQRAMLFDIYKEANRSTRVLKIK